MTSLIKPTFTIGGVTFNTQVTLVIVVGTLLPMFDWYGYSPVAWLLDGLGTSQDVASVKAYDRLVYYLLIPLAIIRWVFREPVAAYGFQWGHWREGLKWTLIGCASMSLILWLATRSAGMQTFYSARAPENVGFLIYITGVDLLGWEFIWRGFMLFTLARVLGPGPAIFIQAIPFAFMHLGKPELETFSTILGGACFGWVAWRSHSFTYPFLIHWYIASLTQWLVLGGA